MSDDPLKDIPETEFATWLTPRQVLDLLQSLGRPLAIQEVIRHAKVGRAKAAGDISYSDRGRLRNESRVPVPYKWWENSSDRFLGVQGSFWISGGVTFAVPDSKSLGGVDIAEFFNVKFRPSDIYKIPGAGAIATVVHGGVRRIDHFPDQRSTAQNYGYKVPPQPPAVQAELPQAGGEKEPDATSKARLPEPHLQAWWTFYKAVTPADRETEDLALAHVHLCFPKNSVARTRIRELRGKATKPGPKQRPAE